MDEAGCTTYKNTYTCSCGAIVGIGNKWRYGYWEEGTSGRFATLGNIPDDHCPICRTPMSEAPKIIAEREKRDANQCM